MIFVKKNKNKTLWQTWWMLLKLYLVFEFLILPTLICHWPEKTKQLTLYFKRSRNYRCTPFFINRDRVNIQCGTPLTLVLKAQPLFFSEDAKERWSAQSAAFDLPLIEKLFRSLQDHQDTLEVPPEWPYMYIVCHLTCSTFSQLIVFCILEIEVKVLMGVLSSEGVNPILLYLRNE